MPSERIVASLSAGAAVLVLAVTPPDPAGPLRLAAAGLVGLGLALALLWTDRRSPLAGAILVLAGLAVSPPPASPVWGLAQAFPALLALAALYVDGRAPNPAPLAGVALAAFGALVAYALLLPRLSVASAPLALLAPSLLVLLVAVAVAILRHARAQDAPAPETATPEASAPEPAPAGERAAP